MDVDGRFRPNSGNGGRVILLGDGTEITTEAPDAEMFDHEEDKDLDSQVDKFHNEGSNGTKASKETTESPSSVQTEKSEDSSATGKDTTIPEKVTKGTSKGEK
jgi:protein phosphatase 2C family protein 2/3